MKKTMTFEEIINLTTKGSWDCEQVKVGKVQCTFRGDYGRLEFKFVKRRDGSRDIVSLQSMEDLRVIDGKKNKCKICNTKRIYNSMDVPLEFIEAFANWCLDIGVPKGKEK